jgi:Glycosyl transferases group 1
MLEPWSNGRPVVSTSVRIEAIKADAGEHALVADSAGDFVSRYLDLMESPELARRVATNAQQKLLEHYTPEAIKRTIASFAGGRTR